MAVLLPLTGAVLCGMNVRDLVQALQMTDPALATSVIAQTTTPACVIPIFTGLAGLTLLAALQAAPRSRLLTVIVVAGAIWPLLSLVPRELLHIWYWVGSVPCAALGMAIAAVLLRRRSAAAPPQLAALASYASIGTVLATAPVPEVFSKPFVDWTDWRYHGVFNCNYLKWSTQAGDLCSALAIGSTLLALIPLAMEVHRLGRSRLAAAISLVLLLSAAALSPAPVVRLAFTPYPGPCESLMQTAPP